MKPYEFHKVVDIFPIIQGQDYDDLRRDIERHGIRNPVVLYRGMVVDGRNRVTIWRDLGRDEADIPTVQWDGKDSLVQFALSMNMQRRHLTDSQRAACAAEATMMFREELRSSRVNAARVTERETARETATGLPAEAVDRKAAKAAKAAEVPHRDPRKRTIMERASELFDMSKRHIERAEFVLKNAPDVHADIKAGKISVVQAEREIRRRGRMDILKSAAAVAAAALESGPPEARTLWSLERGDVVEVLDAMEAGSVRLAFADPPYNQGMDYGDGTDADLKTPEEYKNFCMSWMKAAHRVLSDDGSFWVLISEDWADWFGIWLRLTGFNRRRWIVVRETFGMHAEINFPRDVRHLFYCTKHPQNFIWNFDAVKVESARQQMGDKRAHPDGKVRTNVFDLTRLVDNDPERLPGIPTQLPVEFLYPIVGVSSLPGDLVVDLFAGSGSLGEACITQETGARKFKGIDISERFIEMATARLSMFAPVVPAVEPEPEPEPEPIPEPEPDTYRAPKKPRKPRTPRNSRS